MKGRDVIGKIRWTSGCISLQKEWTKVAPRRKYLVVSVPDDKELSVLCRGPGWCWFYFQYYTATASGWLVAFAPRLSPTWYALNYFHKYVFFFLFKKPSSYCSHYYWNYRIILPNYITSPLNAKLSFIYMDNIVLAKRDFFYFLFLSKSSRRL